MMHRGNLTTFFKIIHAHVLNLAITLSGIDPQVYTHMLAIYTGLFIIA